jgi:hypothetical protein
MERNISYKGVDLVVVGNYYKGEEGVMYYSDLGGLPPSNSEFEITDVFVRDSFISVFNLFSAENLSEIEELVLIEIENYE